MTRDPTDFLETRVFWAGNLNGTDQEKTLSFQRKYFAATRGHFQESTRGRRVDGRWETDWPTREFSRGKCPHRGPIVPAPDTSPGADFQPALQRPLFAYQTNESLRRIVFRRTNRHHKW